MNGNKNQLVCNQYVILFISEESVLLDLKHLLIEAKQKVPPFLANMQSESEKFLDIGGKTFIIEWHSFCDDFAVVFRQNYMM